MPLSAAEEEVLRIYALPPLEIAEEFKWSDFVNACAVLGLDKDEMLSMKNKDDTILTISRVNRKKSALIHPDKHTADETLHVKADVAFKKLQAAQVLLMQTIEKPSLLRKMQKENSEHSMATPPTKKIGPFGRLVQSLFKPEEARARREQEASAKKARLAEEEAKQEADAVRQQAIDQAVLAQEKHAKEQADAEAKRIALQEKFRQEADRKARIASCTNVVTEVRTQLLGVLGLSEATAPFTLPSLLQKLADTFSEENSQFLERLLIGPMQVDLPYFFTDTPLTPHEMISACEDRKVLINIVEYKKKAMHLKLLVVNAHYIALSSALTNHLINEFTSLSAQNPFAKVLEPISPPPNNFLEFAASFTDDPTYVLNKSPQSDQCITLLNESVNQQKATLAELIHLANIIRLNVGDNKTLLAQVNAHFSQLMHLLLDPTSNQFILTSLLQANKTGTIIDYASTIRQAKATFETLSKQLPNTAYIRFSETDSRKSIQSAAALQHVILKTKLERSLSDYTSYTNEHCRFSLFHRHGEAGRQRATQFIAEVCKLSDINTMQSQVYAYLMNKKNGNTHQHSFRTMLLQEFLGPFPSNTFQDKLALLATQWQINPNQNINASPAATSTVSPGL
jgi:hypothetical protein